MATKGKILVILNYLFLISPSYSQTDTILQGQRLSDWEQLFSSNKLFRLQFFTPGSTKNRYLGIFYHMRSTAHFDFQRQAVWIANRDNPIPNASGNLMIDNNGTLKISYVGGNHIDLSSVPSASNTSATLLDSGNLVLRELNSDGSTGEVLWQSFDYPTDTLLPGMKLGINFKTGHKWSLTSWISHEAPGSGSFTFGGDPNGTSRLIIWWRGDIFWTSGIWHNGHFDFAPKLSYPDYYNFSYVSNEDEKYLMYTVTEKYHIARYTLNPFGIVEERGGTVPFGVCSLAGTPDAGCVEQKLPDCRNNNFWFDQRRGYIFGDGFKFDRSYNLSRYDCQAKCVNNCSCVAFSYNGTDCQIWGRGMEFVQMEIQGGEVFLLVPQKVIKWWIWLAIAPLIIVVCYVCYYCYMRFRRLIKEKKQTKILFELGITTKYKDKDKKKSHELQVFNFESIMVATNNFSDTNKLGEGGFGPVYKGNFPNGQDIAVKRLSRSSGQGLVEFKNEILLIAKLQHKNLVRLLGCCIEGEEMILIYEYMHNGSLDFFLFDPSKKSSLDWKRRFTIIEGISQGLLYNHKYSRFRIIHRDLKASNILLDEKMNPKISDFGMARIFGENESEANTKRVVGTFGYMSPEYIKEGNFSIKSDVFSFGVLLLEIVSGKKNHSCYHHERPLNLIGYAWELWRENRGLELLDPTLNNSCQSNEVLRCIHVGLLCVQDNPIDRPIMSEVVSMLTNETTPLSTPKQPAFFIGGNVVEADTFQGKTKKYSMNKVSITEMEAR